MTLFGGTYSLRTNEGVPGGHNKKKQVVLTNFGFYMVANSVLVGGTFINYVTLFLVTAEHRQLAERTKQELQQLDSQIEYHRFMTQNRYNNNPPRWQSVIALHRYTIAHHTRIYY